MADLLPFKRTSSLISNIDEFIDKVAEAVMVLEQGFDEYVDRASDNDLTHRMEQIRGIEARADEIRRAVANVMYTEMLMPDTRGDVLNLLDEVDTTMDDCVHLLISLTIERPDIPEEYDPGFKSIMSEVAKAGQAMLQGARAYFKEPHAVRDHVHKVGFHNQEATTAVLRVGKVIYDSDLPLERKRQLGAWLSSVRAVGSHAGDIADQLAILAVKRSF